MEIVLNNPAETLFFPGSLVPGSLVCWALSVSPVGDSADWFPKNFMFQPILSLVHCYISI